MNQKLINEILEKQLEEYENLLSLTKQIRLALDKTGEKTSVSEFVEKREEVFTNIKNRDETLNKFSAEEIKRSLSVENLKLVMESILEEDLKISEIMSKVKSKVESEIGNANLGSNAIKGYLAKEGKGGFGRFINLKN